jgi:hypothetical protein
MPQSAHDELNIPGTEEHLLDQGNHQKTKH